MKGILITVDGLDGSGKATQVEMVCNRLSKEGYNIRRLEFPDYDLASALPIKMYLKGELGENPEDVNPYLASSFYASNRFESFKKYWEKFYNDGGIVITDRYTTANMLHQSSKLKGEDRDKYLDWLFKYEFEQYGLPAPDGVLFLDVTPDVSIKLMENRNNKFTGVKEKDIHERNPKFLYDSYDAAQYVAKKYNWQMVNCVENGNMKSIEIINDDIYRRIKNIID